MHIWLSQSLDIPNSTVCISLLEQIFETYQKSFWWAAFINNVVISYHWISEVTTFYLYGRNLKPGYYVFEVWKSQAIFQK